MAQAQPFNPIAFKQKMREEWSDAADGWRRWCHVVEGKDGGQRHSAKLVELARVRPGASVLDVGGGYGEPSLTAARVVGPEGRVVCTDISPGLLAFARERAREAGVDNVEFIESDAEQLDFGEESFDAIVSRALLMFLPDVPRALERLLSFLKPAGRFAASVWGEKGKVQFATAGSVIADALALAPPPGQPGVFALADERRLGALVREAGFEDVETGTVSVIFETDTPAQFTEFIRDVAPPFTVLLKDQTPDARARIWAKVTEAYGRFADASGRVRTTNEAIWVAGKKPPRQ
jgi:ubiquinone/menaquinone biosynthesis C-methylase UbiE